MNKQTMFSRLQVHPNTKSFCIKEPWSSFSVSSLQQSFLKGTTGGGGGGDQQQLLLQASLSTLFFENSDSPLVSMRSDR